MGRFPQRAHLVLLVPAIIAAALGFNRRAAAAPAVVHLPLVTSRSGPASLPALPTPPAVEWTEVLRSTPKLPGSRLDFFSVDLDSAPGAGVALYDPLGATWPDAAAWYRTALAGNGWRQLSSDARRMRWAHFDGWLDVGYETGNDGAIRLRLARPLDAVAPPDGRALLDGVAVPRAARRWRFDRSDILSEEYRLTGAPEDALRAFASELLASGWLAEPPYAMSGAWAQHFSRGAAALLLAACPADGEAEVGLGRAVCEPSTDPPPGEGREESVYLGGVPAPPAASIRSYDRDPQPMERWRVTCHDLDLYAASYQARLAGRGWLPDGQGAGTAAVRRGPASLSMAFGAPDGGSTVRIAIATAGGGELALHLSREATGTRSPIGASLLFADSPLPEGADAVQLTRDTADGWQYREVYELSLAQQSSAASWFRRAWESAGWAFERLEPAGDGAAQVFYREGEEALVEHDVPRTGQVTISRRRACPSGRPAHPSPDGAPSRRLREMMAYPGAVYEGFRDDREWYDVTCADLGLMADWYREAMERGDWRLAATEGPDDPFHRRLEFVRPSELGIPPEQRTAWAEVDLARTWPYHYKVALRRDPSGVVPAPPEP